MVEHDFRETAKKFEKCEKKANLGQKSAILRKTRTIQNTSKEQKSETTNDGTPVPGTCTPKTRRKNALGSESQTLAPLSIF